MSADDSWIEHYRFAKLTFASIVDPKVGMREALRIAGTFIGKDVALKCNADARASTPTERRWRLARLVGAELTKRASLARAAADEVPAPQADRAASRPDDFVLTE